MVKKVNTISKQKYQDKKGRSFYLYGGIALAVVIALGIYFGSGAGGTSTALAGPAPSGNNCPENVAYLQQGVNKYKEVKGQFPNDVNQLLEKVKDDKSAVESIPPCPSGNIYLINNGVVVEAPRS